MKKRFHIRWYLAAALSATILSPRLISLAVAQERAPARTLTAILLAARGAISDPNFKGSIVLVMNNIGPAPVGVIINRPMPLFVSRLFPKVGSLSHVHDRVYYGGPVGFGKVWYLFRARAAPTGAIRVCDGVYLSADRELLLKLLGRKQPMKGLRIIVGHAGWAPGQLQAEIEGGAWRPRRADAQSIFNPKPLRPWPGPGGRRPGA
ncbi:MAG TPA: YqgE/AlgH family protein [Steroidobacteraceae bacterium]|nr:YqgE/AlgH family protein [Steroidobacteraceae bacterium]